VSSRIGRARRAKAHGAPNSHGGDTNNVKDADVNSNDGGSDERWRIAWSSMLYRKNAPRKRVIIVD
jgi:hypothetical protein